VVKGAVTHGKGTTSVVPKKAKRQAALAAVLEAGDIHVRLYCHDSTAETDSEAHLSGLSRSRI